MKGTIKERYSKIMNVKGKGLVFQSFDWNFYGGLLNRLAIR